ncbi:MAG: response regulator [Thermoanaerobaculia bacterium]
MSIKILLADDSLTIQKVVELTFSDAETRLMAVGSGDKAVQALDEFQPDIVLADVVMPGLSGYDVCEAVKQRPGGPFVPVVLLTGTFEPFDRARAERVGSDAIVTKPFDSHALQGLVRELVAKAGAAQEAAEAAPPPVPEPPPPPAFTLSDLEAPPESALPVDTGSTLVLTPLDLDAAAPPPFAEAATAAPAGESIYATMAMKVPTPEELAAAAPAPFELAEEPPATEAPGPFEPGVPLPEPVAELAEASAPAQPFEVDEAPESAPPAEAAAPAEELTPWSVEPAPVTPASAEPVLSLEPPPPPPYDPLSAYAPPPPPPFEAAEAFVPPPPPPPPAFYEPEPPAPPPPPPFFEPEPMAADDADVPGPDTAPVLPLVPAVAPEPEPFGAGPVADEEQPAENAPDAPFEPEPSPAAAAEGPIEIELETDGETAPVEVVSEPAAEGPSEAVEPFPEMDAAAHVAEEAPWDEGPAPQVPPPPPLDAGPEELSDGTEPITRDLEADMQAFEESGRVRRRPEIWERHAALIGEEVPEDIDVPGVVPEAPVATPDESPSTDLEEIAAAARLEDLSALIPAGAASGPAEAAVVPEPVAAVTTAPIAPASGASLSDADVDRIARRVVELLSDKAVRDIAWEVVPEYAERLVRERIAEVERAG